MSTEGNKQPSWRTWVRILSIVIGSGLATNGFFGATHPDTQSIMDMLYEEGHDSAQISIGIALWLFGFYIGMGGNPPGNDRGTWGGGPIKPA